MSVLRIDIKWEELEKTEGHPIDIQPTMDVSTLLDEQHIPALASSNNAFENF